MRDIKFRAWSGKHMIYKNNMQSISWPDHLKDTESVWVRCDGNVMGYFKLMQYTGLKDKNGKEIYEGDIVIGDEAFMKVVYGFCAFGLEHMDGTSGPSFVNYVQYEGKNLCLTIIGNIYESPELCPVK